MTLSTESERDAMVRAAAKRSEEANSTLRTALTAPPRRRSRDAVLDEPLAVDAVRPRNGGSEVVDAVLKGLWRRCEGGNSGAPW